MTTLSSRWIPLFLISCGGLSCLLVGCGGREPAPASEPRFYRDLGSDFLPETQRIFEKGLGKKKTLENTWVIWALQGKYAVKADTYASPAMVLCVCRGVEGADKPLWSLLMLTRTRMNEGDRWDLMSRVDIGQKPGFSGRRNFPDCPTASDLDAFLELAELDRQMNAVFSLVEQSPVKNSLNLVKAGPYEEECRELFGKVPSSLVKLKGERRGDENNGTGKK